jgi:3-phenylpropionate/trans-cinnamate dioxygenase ferredoxin subunit
MSDNAAWHLVCDADELDMEDVLGFEHEQKKYAVYRTPSGYYATDGKCTHAGGLLADGLVIGEYIECPQHQARFHIPTGEAKIAPAIVNLKTYPVKIEQGKIFIALPD